MALLRLGSVRLPIGLCADEQPTHGQHHRSRSGDGSRRPADRGVKTAANALDVARTKRDEACGRTLGKTVACKIRRAEVTKLEANQSQATATVVAQAKPQSTDSAKLVTWVRAPFSPVSMILRCSGSGSEPSWRK
jgi:hypothetical protein